MPLRTLKHRGTEMRSIFRICNKSRLLLTEPINNLFAVFENKLWDGKILLVHWQVYGTR